MSYLVLARKWRPKNFTDTVGQEHVLQALTNALESGRLHHAYLFAGTRGVGKTTIARILAKALNCETGVTANPCGECSACREIDEGRFVDLIEVDAASRTKVDDTRELLDNVQYAPSHGRFKVYLIDEVHMLSKSSFNALLKTLEEPPPHVKFLLATTDPQKLPATVLSRCLQFVLKRLTPALIRGRLEYICEAEGVTAETQALSMLARAADGSLRDALSLLDQAIAYCGGDVTEKLVGEMLGTIDRKHVGRVLRLLANEDGPGLMTAIAEIDEQFPDYGHLLDDLARVLQQVAVYQVIGAADADGEVEEAELQALSELVPAEDLQLFYQAAIIGKRDLHLAPDPRSGTEMTLLRMLAFRPGGAPSARPTKPKRAAATVSAAVAELKPPVIVNNLVNSAAAADSPKSGGTKWTDPDWAELIPSLNLGGANRLLAENCAYVQREGNTVFLSLDRRSESLLTRSRQTALADTLSEHFGEKLSVELTLQESENTEIKTPLQKEAQQKGERLDAARESLEADPNVRALRDMFGAELQAGSVEIIDQKQVQDHTQDRTQDREH